MGPRFVLLFSFSVDVALCYKLQYEYQAKSTGNIWLHKVLSQQSFTHFLTEMNEPYCFAKF